MRVTRIDQKPVRGTKLADDSGEMTGDHGPFETVAEAIAHGEAWGRHCGDDITSRVCSGMRCSSGACERRGALPA